MSVSITDSSDIEHIGAKKTSIARRRKVELNFLANAARCRRYTDQVRGGPTCKLDGKATLIRRGNASASPSQLDATRRRHQADGAASRRRKLDHADHAASTTPSRVYAPLSIRCAR